MHIKKENLPSYVLKAAEILRENNYEAYLVGGSVRDILLGKEPKDYDIATNAYPEDVERIFPKSIPTGAQFGTMLVILSDDSGENFEIEITTYRSEADYFGGRWPAKVEFTKSINDDLARRDFTINAIALRLDDGVVTDNDIVDPFGGIRDLERKTIRAVGNALERFSEDGLRSLRACRLAANLGFEIEPETFSAIPQTLQVTQSVSKERVRDELLKLLLNSPKPSLGLDLMRKSGLLKLFIPELLEGENVTQPQYHVDDVYTHTLKTVDIAEDEVKLAALFHDIAKPRTISVDETGIHFYGHDTEGAKMAREIMKRLKFSNAEIERTATLVRWHMFYYPAADWRKVNTNIHDDISTKLIALRHAETKENKEGKVLGQTDPKLSDYGKNEAKSIAQQLRTKHVDQIVSSPLRRARQTAEIIARELQLDSSIVIEPRLSERHFGELQGLTWDEFAQKFPHLGSYPGNDRDRQEYLPGGESISQVESRVKIALFSISKGYKGKTVLLVTHTGVIRIIDRVLAKGNLTEIGNSDFKEYEISMADIDPQFLTDQEIAMLRKEHSEQKNAGGWSDAAIRRLIKNVGGEDMIDDLMKLRIADALANEKASYNPQELHALAERIAEVRKQDMALKVTDLALNGHDLRELGFEGQEIGKILNHLLEEVIDDPLLNSKDKLKELALSKFAQQVAV